MITNYKPLTDEQIDRIQNEHVRTYRDFARAIEQAAIENYLAQREPADAWLLTLRSLLNDLIAHAQANGLEIARAGDVLESTAQVGFRLAGILEHAKRFVSTPPAPQDAQVGKDAELADYKENGLMAVRYASSSAHWSNELRRLFGPDAREGIDLLEKRLREAEGRIEYLARKVCFTGIGDGSAHMHIINLPDAKHFPENGEYKRLFLDTIDAAIAAAKGKE